MPEAPAAEGEDQIPQQAEGQREQDICRTGQRKFDHGQHRGEHHTPSEVAQAPCDPLLQPGDRLSQGLSEVIRLGDSPVDEPERHELDPGPGGDGGCGGLHTGSALHQIAPAKAGGQRIGDP